MIIYKWLVAALSAVALLGCGNNNSTGTGSSANAGAAQKKSATLSLTPDQYARQFNQYMAQSDMPYRLNLKVESGQHQNVFQSSLNERIGMVGSADKNNGKITSIAFTAAGDGSNQSGKTILIVAVAAFAAALPEVDVKRIASEVMAVHQEFKEGSKKPSKRVINNVEFTYERSKEFGSLYGISPVK